MKLAVIGGTGLIGSRVDAHLAPTHYQDWIQQAH
jgi:uncharacterized protein YbjT (DUF2867 family)